MYDYSRTQPTIVKTDYWKRPDLQQSLLPVLFAKYIEILIGNKIERKLEKQTVSRKKSLLLYQAWSSERAIREKKELIYSIHSDNGDNKG